MQLFDKLFAFVLTRETAAATTANYCIRSYLQDGCFRLEFFGYNQKLLMVVEATLKTLMKTLDDMDEKHFEILKADFLKNFKNMLLFPFCLQSIVLSKVMQTNSFDPLDYDREINRITTEDSQKMAKKFFSDAKIQILLQGNVESSNAESLTDLLIKNLTTSPFMVIYLRK